MKEDISSITEHAFQGIPPSPWKVSVTYVSGKICNLCVGMYIESKITVTPDGIRLKG